MSTNDTFQARIVTSLSTPGGPEAIKIFNELDAASKHLSGDAKKAAEEVAKLFKAFNEGKTNGEQFMLQLEGMGNSLKLLSNIQKTKALTFSSEEVNNVLNMAKALTQMSKAFTELQKAQGVGKGNYGLDSKTVKESSDALKVLDTNLKAVKFGLSQQPASPGLMMQRDQIQGNIDALTRYRNAQQLTKDAFNLVGRNVPTMQRETTTVGIRNFAENAKAMGAVWKSVDKNIQIERKNAEAEYQRTVKAGLNNYTQTIKGFSKLWSDVAGNIDTQHNKEIKAGLANYVQTVKGLGAVWASVGKNIRAEQLKTAAEAFKSQDVRYQLRKEDSQFYRTSEGRTTAFNRYDVKQAGNEAAQAPGFVQSKIFGTQRSEEARYLRDAFAQANVKYQSSGAVAADTEKVKSLLTQVLQIEKEIILARAQGKIDLQAEAGLIAKIGQLQKQTNIERQKGRATDPLIRQAEQESQTRRMFERISGSSGGALLAVQATLMGNYSVLQGIKTAITTAITYSLDLEAAFKNIQAVTVTTRTEMVGLEEAIKRTAGTTKFNAKEVADAALILGQAGLSARQIAEAIQPVTMLATASGATLAQAVDIVTSVVGVFNITVGQTAEVTNKITHAVNVSKLSIEKLALGFQYAGNTAAQLGISFEEVTAAMAAMSNAGIKSGSTMGTGLRQLLIELQNPSQEFIASLHQVGLTIGDLDLKTQSFSAILRKLRDAGFAASEAIKSFDVRGAAAFNSLIANPEMLDATVAGMNNTKAAVEANEIQMEALQNQIARLTSAFGNLVSAGFAPVQEALTKVIGGFATFIQSLSEAQTGVELLGTAVAGGLVLGAGAFIKMMGRNILALAGDLALLSATAPGIARVGSTLVAAATGTGVFTAALTALKVVLSPAVLLGAFGAVTAAVWAYNKITGSAKGETERLQTALDKAKGTMNEKKEVVDSLTKKITELEGKTRFYTENQQALNLETQNLTSTFGRFGFSADGASIKIGELINKVRGLKVQLENLQSFEMKKVLRAGEDLAEQKTNEALAAGKATTSGFFGKVPDISTILTNPAFTGLLKSQGALGTQRLSVLTQYQKQVQAGVPVKDIPELGTVADIVQTLAKESKSRKAPEDIQTRSFYTYQTNVLEDISSRLVKAAEASAATAKVLAENAVQREQIRLKEETDKFNKTTGFQQKLLRVGPGFEGGGNLSDLAKGQLGKGASTVDIYARGKVLFSQAMTHLDKLSAEVDEMDKSKKYDPSVIHEARVQLKGAVNKYVNQFQTLATDAKDLLDYSATTAKLQNESERRLAETKQKRGVQMSAELERVERQRSANALNERLRNILPTNTLAIETAKKEEQAILETNLQTIRERAQQLGEEAARKSLEVQISSLQRQINMEMGKAKAAKGNLKPEASMADIDKNINEALKNLMEAKKLAIRKAELQIKAGTGTQEDLTTVTEQFATNYSELIRSYESEISSRVKEMSKVGEMIKATKNKIDQMKVDAQEKEYARGVRSRELNIQAAEEGPTGMKAAYRQTELASAQGGLSDVRAVMFEVSNSLSQIQANLIGKNERRVQVTSELEKFKGLSANERAKLTPQEQLQEFKLTKELDQLKDDINTLERQGIEYQKEKNNLLDQEYEARLRIANASDKSAKPLNLDSYSNAFKKALEDYKEDMKKLSPEETLASGFYQTLTGVQDKFATLFTDIGSGSKSASQAFRAFAGSIVSELLKIAAQQAAIALVKSIFGLFSGGMGGGDTAVNGSAGSGFGVPTARHGGSISRWGTVQRFAGGGPVTGGIPGRDSVPALVMPGEFVLKSTAVDAVGTDFLHALNNAGNGVVSSSSPKQGPALTQSGSGTVNVWVVSPDQKPVPGPKDIVAIVTDDMARGGSIKQMVKSVQMGTV